MSLVMTPVVRRSVAALSLLAPIVGCQLQEVSIAEPHELVIAEMVLYAGDVRQRALLHRTFGESSSATRIDARIEVRSETNAVLSFTLAPDSLCLFTDSADTSKARGSCYVSPAQPSFVRPGGRYAMQIDLADGGSITGTTVVPDTFTVLRPAPAAAALCVLPPDTPLEMLWTRSQGAWVYVVEAELRRILPALRERGITLRRDPLRLVGLSISESDTTIVFPTELGIFDRFDDDVTSTLLALRNGLPPGVDAEVLVTAGDRNYVNWVRGGRFNPSGQVRVPSVRGDGTGVFGSMTPRRLRITTTDGPNRAPC
jgi:hypothetical protein